MVPLFGQEKLPRHHIPNSNNSNHLNPNEDDEDEDVLNLNGGGGRNSGHFPAGTMDSSPSTTSRTSATLRKYLVILQDSVAIKFVPLVPGHQSHPYPLAFNNPTNNHIHNKSSSRSSSSSGSGNSRNDQKSIRRNNNNNEDEENNGNGNSRSNRINYVGSENSSGRRGQEMSLKNSSNNTGGNASLTNYNNEDPHGLPTNSNNNNSQHKSMRKQAFNNNFRTALGSATAEVDHSLHGLYLYKGFREANLQCYWNAALSETFRNIEYKGYIVPSTILISALPRFLTILRTAWSRQMLRSPAGYRIEFIGEIEELIADPIRQGQFAPLSDSLCWAILELTSIGQEAFVDSIMNALKIAFPTMGCPTRELVYQTLEKLIRERKVYQTSHGYFVVTPDTLRYMTTADFESQLQGMTSQFSYNPALTLDALMVNNYEPDQVSFSRQSRDSGVSAEHPNLSNHEDLLDINEPRVLKRHNSLKTFRQKDLVAVQSANNTLRKRSSSFRLGKSKSCDRVDIDDEDDEVKGPKGRRSTLNHIANAMRNFKMPGTKDGTKGGTKDLEKNSKGKSLFSKIFQFRRSSSKPRKSASSPSSPKSSPELRRNSRSFNQNHQRSVSTNRTTSRETQTSSSNERLVSPSPESSLSSSGSGSVPKIQRVHDDLTTSAQLIAANSLSNAGDLTMRGSVNANANADGNSFGDELMFKNTMQTSSPSQNPMVMVCQPRPESRRSTGRSPSTFNQEADGPLYEEVPHVHEMTSRRSRSPNYHNHNGHTAVPISPNFPSFHREESSRCSTLSQGTSSLSLGYGSQGYPSLNMSSGGYSNNFNCNSVSHSPCEVNYDPNQPQGPVQVTDTKPMGYSTNGFKNPYDFHRRIYPSYTSSFSRGSPHYATLTGSTPRVKSTSSSKGHQGNESLLTTTSCSRDSSANRSGNGRKSAASVELIRASKPRNDPSMSETTVTQNVKSTTDMELELLLPLGNIMKAALNAKKQSLKEQFFRREYNREPPIQETRDTENIPVNLENSGIEIRVGEPRSQTEVKTTVDNNGLIETHFHTLPGEVVNNLSSTIEIEANGENKVILTTNKSKNGKNTKHNINSNGLKNSSSNNNKQTTRKSSRVKISDIGRDSDEDLDFKC